MRAAYAALDEEMRSKVDRLNAYHSNQYSIARRTGQIPKPRPKEDPDSAKKSSSASKDAFKGTRTAKGYGQHGLAFLRPLVKTHPETGRKNLQVASHAFGIQGFSPEESEKFMDDLVIFACQPPRTFKHSWQSGDLAIWD